MVSPQGQEPAGFLLVPETEALNSANSCIWIGKPLVFTVTMGHHGSPWVIMGHLGSPMFFWKWPFVQHRSTVKWITCCTTHVCDTNQSRVPKSFFDHLTILAVVQTCSNTSNNVGWSRDSKQALTGGCMLCLPTRIIDE